MRVAFFGSPAFATPSLDALIDAGHDVRLVVSQPAKSVGRHAEPADPPVAARARTRGLRTFQPPTLRDDGVAARLAEEPVDLFVVVAYGKILPEAVLAIPRLGCVNVHGSILPRWRGASPVQAALLAGDEETGVSLMRMDAGMDTGPVYAVARTAIGADETAGTLSARLADLGARLLVETLPAIESGDRLATPQAGEGVTHCPKIARDDGRVAWTRSAVALERAARAYAPWPGLFTSRAGRRLKLEGVGVSPGSGEPGVVLEAGDRVVVACGDGAVSVARLQAEGRRMLGAAEFVRGERLVAGERLG